VEKLYEKDPLGIGKVVYQQNLLELVKMPSAIYLTSCQISP